MKNKKKALALENEKQELRSYHNSICSVQNDIVAENIITTAYEALPSSYTLIEKYNIIASNLNEQVPKDATEARLRVKEVLLFSQAMEYVKKSEYYASLKEPFADHWQSFYMKFALKLLRLHGEIVNDIERYRRGGRQNITVQHVTMNDNAKAVIN